MYLDFFLMSEKIPLSLIISSIIHPFCAGSLHFERTCSSIFQTLICFPFDNSLPFLEGFRCLYYFKHSQWNLEVFLLPEDNPVLKDPININPHILRRFLTFWKNVHERNLVWGIYQQGYGRLMMLCGGAYHLGWWLKLLDLRELEKHRYVHDFFAVVSCTMWWK